VCDACWSATPSRVRRAVAKSDARTQRLWAEGKIEVAPAPRKKRSSRKHRGEGGPPAQPAEAAPQRNAEPARLSFLAAELPPPPASRGSAPAAEASVEPLRPVPPPAQLRREQARLRRAALIADQLGDRDLPLYLVDFMIVEDAAAELGFERAVETVARREGREPGELEDAWHRAVERIASDESCRYVDALRPYIDRIDADLDDAEEDDEQVGS
jgi:hypothetical protein